MLRSDDEFAEKVFWVLGRLGFVVIGTILILGLFYVPAAIDCVPQDASALTSLGVSSLILFMAAWFLVKATYILRALDSDKPYQRRRAGGLVFYSFVLGIVMFALLYKSYGIIATSGPAVAPTILDHLYFSLVTFTTLGYGDFRPCSQTRLIAATQALMGFLYYPFLIAIALDVMGSAKTDK